MNTRLHPALLLVIGTLALASCSKDDDTTVTPAVQAKTVSNLATVGTTSTTGAPVAPKHYTFYSLVDGKEVAYTDSNSTKWDVAVNRTTIIINGGSSGPGQGGAQVLSKLFAEVTTAPTSGYAVDAVGAPAIPISTGNPDRWYTYNSSTNVVTPTAGRVLMIRTAAGKYAKMEILSYYQNAPTAPTSANASGYYTFRYVYQPSGTSLQ
ncbi:MAG: hypothetical protein EOO63_17975 [Hymenobacter sp.]|nr:MAG: hypothetical protein EOO63_17975 [Hymenobacter sp.]